MKPAFIDLSHHNTIPESLVPARQSGILGVVHKATEGASYVDEKLSSRAYLAREAGMLWGVYHFIRPGDIEQQVDHFLNATISVCDDDTMYALDWEDNEVSLEDAIAFMQRLERMTEHSPVLYSGHVVKEAMDGPDPRINCYRLWLAQYSSSPTLPPGWDGYWAWQYTDQGSVPGINPPTDLNAYSGADLASDWSGFDQQPEPVPPDDDVGSIVLIVPEGLHVEVITRKATRRWRA